MSKRKMPTNKVNRELRQIPEELKVTNVETPKEVKPTVAKVVNCKTLNVRRTPEKKDNVILVFPLGENVNLIKETDDWTLVESIRTGKSGWVMSSYLQKVE